MKRARRALPAAARRHAAPVAHQRVLPRRRQGAAERVLRARPRRSASRSPTTPRSSTSTFATARFASATVDARRRASTRFARRRWSRPRGGFESNLDWLREAWGPPADNFIVRGTPYNIGTRAEAAARRRARSRSAIPTQGHCVAIDARSPKFDGGIVTRVDCVSLGIVVNQHARALLRRGRGLLAEALRDLGAAGRRPARPDRLLDHRRQVDRASSCRRCSRRSRRARSRELAARSGSTPTRSSARCAEFNAAVRPGTFDHTMLDDCRTEGLDAAEDALGAAASTRRRSTPIRCGPGITFTYLGVGDRRARAHADGRRRAVRRTSSRRARSWRATCSARAISPASAWRSARRSGASRARRPRAMSAPEAPRLDELDRGSAARAGDLQRLPLLRGLLRGLPGARAAARRSTRATSTTSPTSATTAARASTRASTRRRTSSSSNFPRVLAQVRKRDLQKVRVAGGPRAGVRAQRRWSSRSSRC